MVRYIYSVFRILFIYFTIQTTEHVFTNKRLKMNKDSLQTNRNELTYTIIKIKMTWLH